MASWVRSCSCRLPSISFSRSIVKGRPGTTRGSRSATSLGFLPARPALPRTATLSSMLGTGKQTTSRAGSGTWTTRLSRCLQSIVHTWDVRFAGFHSRVSLCVLATAARITRMAPGPLALRSADCSSTATESKTENSSSRPARCPRLGAGAPRSPRWETRNASDPRSRRVV